MIGRDRLATRSSLLSGATRQVKSVASYGIGLGFGEAVARSIGESLMARDWKSVHMVGKGFAVLN